MKEQDTEPKDESVAATEAPAKEVVWMNFMDQGRLLIRNLKNNNVYLSDSSEVDPDKMAKRDCFMGSWVDGALDPYGEQVDEE